MITKNSSGSNLNANYGSVIQSDSRSFQAKLFLNGSELSCDILGLTAEKGSCGSSEGFSVGSVIANTLTCRLGGLSTSVKGEDIQVRIGLEISGSPEWVTLGTFTVTEAVTTQYETNVTAYGPIVAKTGVPFTAPATQSIGNIKTAIETATGLTVVLDQSINQTKVITKPLSGLNCYQVLQIVAACCGGYATDTYDGKIDIRAYSDTATLSVDTDLMTSPPQIEEQPFEVVGVLVHVSEAEDVERTISGSINISGTGTVNIQSLTWLLPTLPTGTAFTVEGTYTVNSVQSEIYESFTYGTGSDVILDSDDEFTLHLIYTGAGLLLQLNSSNMAYSVSGEINKVTYTEHIAAVQYPATPTGYENVVITNEYMTADIFSSIMEANLVGYEYYPAEIPLALGDPRLEGNDVLEVTDVAGNTRIVPCHSVRHTYDGGFSTEITAVKATTEDDSLATESPISTRLNQINQSLAQAKMSADKAYDSAQSARQSASAASEAAQSAISDAATANAAAIAAASDAASALASSTTANKAANGALAQLSVVEDVLGTLNWVSEHATYKASQDTEVMPGKLYFTKSGNTYTPVSNPTGNPSTSGYYEIDSITEAVSNYVASHLSLTNDGLWVLNDNNSYKILLSSTGMKVYDASGVLVSTFGESIVFGSTRTQVIGGESNYIMFDPNDGSITINGSNVKIGNTGKKLSEVLTGIDVSVTQTASGANITVNGDTVSIANGATGATGATGPQGATGPSGATGPQGATGSQGPRGNTGATGATGSQGSTGRRGGIILKTTTAPSSYTTQVGDFSPKYRISLSTVKTQSGSSDVFVGDVIEYSYYHYPVGYVDSSYVYTAARTSLRGAKGATGDQGPAGATGSQGPQGVTGPQGATGPQGVTGSQGPQGATGQQGPRGATGSQGPKGATGSQGPKGATGAQGATGATGSQGPTGATGPQGTTGPSGPEALVTITASSVDCESQTATLTAVLRVDGTVTTPSSYVWTKGTDTTSLGTSQSITIDGETLTADGVYNCKVTWSGGTQTGSFDIQTFMSVYDSAGSYTDRTASTVEDKIPQSLSDLENDADYITSQDVPTQLSELGGYDTLNEQIGGLSADISNVEEDLSGQISDTNITVNNLVERAEIVDSAVIIDPNEPSVTVVRDPSRVKITNEAIELKGGSNATTYITPNGLETTTMTAQDFHPRVKVEHTENNVTTVEDIGPFIFMARENGNFSLKKSR